MYGAEALRLSPLRIWRISMNKKGNRLSTLLLAFSIFLFICTIINLFAGHIGAAICGLAAGGFCMCIWYVYQNKSNNDDESKQ